MTRDIEMVVIHCAATKPDMDWGAKEIRRVHVMERDWSDIGYHYVIKRDGTLEAGRPESRMGAHAFGYNQKSIGVCLVGGLADDGYPAANYTQAQYETLRLLLQDLAQRYCLLEIVGHNDLNAGKTCPVFNVAAYLKRIGLERYSRWPKKRRV